MCSDTVRSPVDLAVRKLLCYTGPKKRNYSRTLSNCLSLTVSSRHCTSRYKRRMLTQSASIAPCEQTKNDRPKAEQTINDRPKADPSSQKAPTRSAPISGSRRIVQTKACVCGCASSALREHPTPSSLRARDLFASAFRAGSLQSTDAAITALSAAA